MEAVKSLSIPITPFVQTNPTSEVKSIVSESTSVTPILSIISLTDPLSKSTHSQKPLVQPLHQYQASSQSTCLTVSPTTLSPSEINPAIISCNSPQPISPVSNAILTPPSSQTSECGRTSLKRPSSADNLLSPNPSTPSTDAPPVKHAHISSEPNPPPLNQSEFPRKPSQVKMYLQTPNSNVISTRPRRSSSQDLFDCIERNPRMPETVAWSIFKQLVDAVMYLHEMGYVHRDIKDENVIHAKTYLFSFY